MVRTLFLAGMIGFCACSFAKEIVVVGDSLSCGPFGRYLLKDFVDKGHSVTLYCAVSSAPHNWLEGKSPSGQICQTMDSQGLKLRPCGGDGRTPRLEDLLSKHQGSQFIIGLGTNTLLEGLANPSYERMAKNIRAQNHDCIWIGPPRMNPSQSKGFPKGRIKELDGNLNDFYDSLSESIESRCKLVDSRDATAPETPGNQTVDGVHRTDLAGKYWVEQISSKLGLFKAELSDPKRATR